MICPKCKCEYREGFTRCSDCGCLLRKPKKGQQGLIIKAQRESDNREWIRLIFIIVLILFAFFMVQIGDSLGKPLEIGLSLFFGIFLISGGIMSLCMKLPIFGASIYTFFKIEKEEYDFFDGLVSIVVIILALVFMTKILTS